MPDHSHHQPLHTFWVQRGGYLVLIVEMQSGLLSLTLPSRIIIGTACTENGASQTSIHLRASYSGDSNSHVMLIPGMRLHQQKQSHDVLVEGNCSCLL